jgi:hypothetical protein
MKKNLVIGLLIFAASAGLSFGQGLTTTIGKPSITIPKAKPLATPEPVTSARGGVVPTAVRNGNPLQMLNPKAPVRYGNSQQHITTDPNDPGKPTGISLFAWTF